MSIALCKLVLHAFLEGYFFSHKYKVTIAHTTSRTPVIVIVPIQYICIKIKDNSTLKDTWTSPNVSHIP